MQKQLQKMWGLDVIREALPHKTVKELLKHDSLNLGRVFGEALFPKTTCFLSFPPVLPIQYPAIACVHEPRREWRSCNQGGPTYLHSYYAFPFLTDVSTRFSLFVVSLLPSAFVIARCRISHLTKGALPDGSFIRFCLLLQCRA
jgi:hypothetical protein